MNICDAIDIVLELARENIMSEQDAEENDMRGDRAKAFDACNQLDDFACNHLGDDDPSLIELENKATMKRAARRDMHLHIHDVRVTLSKLEQSLFREEEQADEA